VLRRLVVLVAVALTVLPAFAQGTTGALEGTIRDEQGLALPGATVTARNAATGFARTATSDAAGVFRFTALPIGSYEVTVTLTGFAGASRKDTGVNIGATTSIDFRMSVAGQTEQISVVADAPLIDANQTGVGEVITQAQIENLPLNGRQFGNLAALVPGVSLGFHTDPTKSTQFAPQVAGGGGRNINYLIDGGDNNDDTVGGLVQNFPLDSIGEFNFETQRFRADSGRANGGVLKVVTKSGTNEFRGSVFEYYRNDALNSQTETEKLAGVEKGEYKRHQFGGSLGGPIVKDKTHFFLSYERVQQDTTQPVDTLGLYPDQDGVFDLPFRENLFVGKITHQVNADNYLSVRYGYNDNSQPYGASPQAPPDSWGDSENTFHSVNANLNSVLGGGKINEFVFQYSYFKNQIVERSNEPSEQYPNGVFVGQSVNTPQQTEQHKYQFRDDFTWTTGRHELKAGVSFIYEPTLDITFSTGQQPLYVHLADSRTSPISSITFNGSIGGSGLSIGQIPNKQYSLYLQDGWRVNDKLHLDLGVRYDLVTGFAFDQDENIIFAELQEAGRAGRLAGFAGFEDFGKEPEEDKNNIAPRAGFTYDVNADGRFVLRGGLGRYYDFAYTNANILFAVIGAQSAFGQVYSNTNSSGIRNADGSFFQVGQPLPPNQLTNVTRPRPSHAASPLIKQPYTDQANLGFSKAIGNGYAIEVDAVYAAGNDLGLRPRLNTRTAGGTSPRRLQGILPTTGASDFRIDISEGESHYKGISFTAKKRWDGKLQMLVSYTLSESTSNTSLRATDEFGEYDVLDATDPFADRQEGPTRTDHRHRITASAVWSPGMDFTISPIVRYKSAQAYNIITGVDNNLDGRNWDLPPGAETLNSGRGEGFFQWDMRISKRFKINDRARFELIAEGFNLTNDTNPGGYVAPLTSSSAGQPTLFAGDFQRGEQRLFQLGARFEF
jgi:hypothetical protein